MKQEYLKFYGDLSQNYEDIDRAWKEADTTHESETIEEAEFYDEYLTFDNFYLTEDHIGDIWNNGKDKETEDYDKFREVFMSDLRFRPADILTVFVSSVNFQADENKTINFAKKVLDEYKERGGNCEIIKLMFAKRETALLKELQESPDDEQYQDLLKTVRSLQTQADRIHTPYDCLFDRTADMLEAQKELDKLNENYKPENDERIRQLEQEIERLEEFIQEKSKDFDPKMLQSIADNRVDLVKEQASAETAQKGTNLLSIDPDALKIARYMQSVAKERVRDQDEENE